MFLSSWLDCYVQLTWVVIKVDKIQHQLSQWMIFQKQVIPITPGPHQLGGNTALFLCSKLGYRHKCLTAAPRPRKFGKWPSCFHCSTLSPWSLVPNSLPWCQCSICSEWGPHDAENCAGVTQCRWSRGAEKRQCGEWDREGGKAHLRMHIIMVTTVSKGSSVPPGPLRSAQSSSSNYPSAGQEAGSFVRWLPFCIGQALPIGY